MILRDNDRRLCYRAEKAFRRESDPACVRLSLQEFRDLVALAWKENGNPRYRLPTVELHEPRAPFGADANSTFARIRVHPSMLLADVALHEVAHLIVGCEERHGRVWQACYARLLDRYVSEGTGARFLSALQELKHERRLVRVAAARTRKRYRLERETRGPVLCVDGNVTTRGAGTWNPADWPKGIGTKERARAARLMRQGYRQNFPVGNSDAWFRMVPIED